MAPIRINDHKRKILTDPDHYRQTLCGGTSEHTQKQAIFISKTGLGEVVARRSAAMLRVVAYSEVHGSPLTEGHWDFVGILVDSQSLR